MKKQPNFFSYLGTLHIPAPKNSAIDSVIYSQRGFPTIFFPPVFSLLQVWAGLAPNPLIADGVKIGNYLFHFITYLGHR